MLVALTTLADILPILMYRNALNYPLKAREWKAVAKRACYNQGKAVLKPGGYWRMNSMQNYRAEAQVAEQSRFMTKVYLWMAFGLFSTAYAGYTAAHSEVLQGLVFGSRWGFFALLALQFGLVIGLSALIQKINSLMATVLFFIYSVITGLTLSAIFLVYTQESILGAFAVSGGTFGVLSAYGFATKRDLSPMGSFLLMALIGLILAMVVNMFFHNSMAELAISVIAVLIFAGLTAYDTQKLKGMYASAALEGPETAQKMAIMGALRLYLDFINLFLNILRLMGRRR
jgi:FtsH-binding integral membrane protein